MNQIVYLPCMDDTELNHLLRLHRESRRPVPPAHLAQNVWREIRRRKAEAAEAGGWLGWLLEPFRRPRMVAPALALALVLGVAVGVAGVPAKANPARYALDLEVFSPSAPSLPSTLLAFPK